MRARAVENLAYVIAPAQYGVHENGRRTYGHTMIVGPWGEVRATRGDGDGVVVTDVDLDTLADLRERFPSLAHRCIS